jgi:hypothetical protein
VFVGSPAARAAGYRASPPEGWSETEGLGEGQARAVAGTDPFGGVKFDVKVTGYSRPGEGVFFVTWMAATEPSPDPPAAIRRALDDIRATRLVSDSVARSTEEVSYRESIADGAVDARLSWRHRSNETETHVRTLAWVSPDRKVRALRGECILAAAAPIPVHEACKAALGSLAPAEAIGELGTIPAATAPDEDAARRAAIPAEPATGDAGPAAAAGSRSEPPPASRSVLYQQPPAEESSGWLPKLLVCSPAPRWS